MAHITLSIPDELYKEMKKHPEIRWSEAARRGIREQMTTLKGVIKGEDWFKSLPESTRKGIEELEKFSKEDWRSWHKNVKEAEWKKAKSLMRVS